MTGFDLSTATNITIGGTQASAVYLGNNLIWPTNHDYSQDYFTIESLEDSNRISIKRTVGSSTVLTLYVSTDNGVTWNSISIGGGSQGLEVNICWLDRNEKVLIKSENDYFGSSSYINYFSMTKTCNIYGNIMSLLYGDNFISQTTFSPNIWNGYPNGHAVFECTFMDCPIISAENLVLPAITLPYNCYYRTFRNCTSMIKAPKILPATNLQIYCYYAMFYNCSSLTVAPELPATTLANGCYASMFYNCSSLTVAPELPATNLIWNCYDSMFMECYNLNYVKMMALDIIEPGIPGVSGDAPCTTDMLTDVAPVGTFIKNVNATWTESDLVPSGWTVQTASN